MFDTDALETATSSVPLSLRNPLLCRLLPLRAGQSAFMAPRLPYK